MKRGYIRPTKRIPRQVQWDALIADGVDPGAIYVEGEIGTWADCLKSLRPEAEDEVVVYLLQVVAGNKRDLRRAMMDARAKKARIKEAYTQRRSDDPDHVTEMVFDALTRKGHSPEKASEYGAQASHPLKETAVPEAEARAIWTDARIRTNKQAAEKIGLSVQQCYNRWGYSGRPAGRPKALK